MRRRVTFGLVVGLLGACSGPGGTSTPVAQSWNLVDYTIVVPSDWTVHEEPDESGFNIVDPPTGDGRLAFIEIVDNTSPTVTAAYAIEQGSKSIEAVGLPTDGLAAERRAPSHYSISAAGRSQTTGEYMTATVHVFEPGIIVLGYYRTPDATDPNVGAAETILSSVWPAGTN